jgi:putative endonuclease
MHRAEQVRKSVWIDVQSNVLRRLDALALRWKRRREAEHLRTGFRGEREALLHLRKQGYTVVARRWKTPKLRGDVDLIAWDGEWLCFVEVKTRSSRGLVAAEAAIDDDKQTTLRRMARAYLRGFPEPARSDIPVRFDVVSVYFEPAGHDIEVQKGAFRWA